MSLQIAVDPFGSMPDGTPVSSFTLRDDAGISVRAISLGGIITAIEVPDRVGRRDNVVLGYATLDGYLHDRSYFGALIGRYANRIGRGHLELDGRRYQLPPNDGLHHLHGGPGGFHARVWQGTPLNLPDGVGVRFTRTSPDGEEGYPGTLHVSVQYTLHPAGRFSIEYSAESDATTVVNLTQHSYFNLRGDRATALEHELSIDADAYTLVSADLIPVGAHATVDGTAFDFRSPTSIGARLGVADEQLRFGRGYDHNWVLRGANGALRPVARVRDPFSGRTLTVATTEPGLQFYGGGQLEGDQQYTGFCLETQHFPDGPNQPLFPSTVLRPHERYGTVTNWTFGID